MADTDPAPSEIARRSILADLSRMAANVESQLAGAITAFERRDVAAAEKLIAADARIDAFDRDIERHVIKLLESGVLAGAALREVVTAMKLTGELERVGDLAKNVAKRTLVVSREAPAKPTPSVVRMGRSSLRQLSDVLNAYASRDLNGVDAVWRGDDEIDEHYNSVFQDLLKAMMADPAMINACTHLVFIAKNFERVGDHATNIAEAVHYMFTGERIDAPRPKGDETSTTVVPTPEATSGG